MCWLLDEAISLDTTGSSVSSVATYLKLDLDKTIVVSDLTVKSYEFIPTFPPFFVIKNQRENVKQLSKIHLLTKKSS